MTNVSVVCACGKSFVKISGKKSCSSCAAAPHVRQPRALKSASVKKPSRAVAHTKLLKMLRDEAKNCGDVMSDFPDTQPSDVACDMAAGCVDDEMIALGKICGLSRSTIIEILADNMHDVMTKGKKL